MNSTSSTGVKNSGTTESTPQGITVDHGYLENALGTDIPADIQRLGIDGAGEVHYFSPRAAWVWVVDADGGLLTITHEADLSGRQVHEWLDHVRGERGTWRACNYDRSLGEGLANALKRGQEADR